jgi:C-terminal processing protease CtpA/Prc
VDWNAIYEQGVTSVTNSSSDADLMEVLYQMITPLADAHVQITSDSLGTASVDGKPTLVERLINEYAGSHGLSLPLPVAYLEGVTNYIAEQLSLYQAIILSYAEDTGQIRSAANDQLIWFMVDNIAYLQIGGMAGFSEDAEDYATELAALDAGLDQLLEDIQFSDGLIIDVRRNNGGSDFLSMAIASRFVDGERLVFSKQARNGNETTPLSEVTIQPRGSLQYLKPVVLLTSNSTVSAAEVFALMMRSLPQVTLMGESTQGALSDALNKVLPNGFVFSLSNEFYYSSEGEWFEHQGIPVDIEVPFFTQEQRLDESDAGLESAYAFLIGNL